MPLYDETEAEERSWQDFANCLGVDPDLFFPERGASTREAKEVCRGCTVREDCLEYALQNGERFGVWGGMSERERRRIRRQRALARKVAAAIARVEPAYDIEYGNSTGAFSTFTERHLPSSVGPIMMIEPIHAEPEQVVSVPAVLRGKNFLH